VGLLARRLFLPLGRRGAGAKVMCAYCVLINDVVAKSDLRREA